MTLEGETNDPFRKIIDDDNLQSAIKSEGHNTFTEKSGQPGKGIRNAIRIKIIKSLVWAGLLDITNEELNEDLNE